MAATYTLISSNTLSASAASVTFSSIPATYTDLVIRLSARGDDSGTVLSGIYLVFNNDSGSTTTYSDTILSGSGTAATSSRDSSVGLMDTGYTNVGSTATANTFSNAEIYIPSYTVSQSKPMSIFGVEENNATTAYRSVVAGLYRVNTAISTIKLQSKSSTNFVSGSSFYLYGIKNS